MQFSGLPIFDLNLSAVKDTLSFYIPLQFVSLKSDIGCLTIIRHNQKIGQRLNVDGCRGADNQQFQLTPINQNGTGFFVIYTTHYYCVKFNTRTIRLELIRCDFSDLSQYFGFTRGISNTYLGLQPIIAAYESGDSTQCFNPASAIMEPCINGLFQLQYTKPDPAYVRSSDLDTTCVDFRGFHKCLGDSCQNNDDCGGEMTCDVSRTCVAVAKSPYFKGGCCSSVQKNFCPGSYECKSGYVDDSYCLCLPAEDPQCDSMASTYGGCVGSSCTDDYDCFGPMPCNSGKCVYETFEEDTAWWYDYDSIANYYEDCTEYGPALLGENCTTDCDCSSILLCNTTINKCYNDNTYASAVGEDCVDDYWCKEGLHCSLDTFKCIQYIPDTVDSSMFVIDIQNSTGNNDQFLPTNQSQQSTGRLMLNEINCFAPLKSCPDFDSVMDTILSQADPAVFFGPGAPGIKTGGAGSFFQTFPVMQKLAQSKVESKVNSAIDKLNSFCAKFVGTVKQLKDQKIEQVSLNAGCNYVGSELSELGMAGDTGYLYAQLPLGAIGKGCVVLNPCLLQVAVGVSEIPLVLPLPPTGEIKFSLTDVFLLFDFYARAALPVDNLWYYGGSGAGQDLAAFNLGSHMLFSAKYKVEGLGRKDALTMDLEGQVRLAINLDPLNNGIGGTDFAFAIVTTAIPTLVIGKQDPNPKLDKSIKITGIPCSLAFVMQYYSSRQWTVYVAMRVDFSLDSFLEKAGKAKDLIKALIDVRGNLRANIYADQNNIALYLRISGSVQFLPAISNLLGIRPFQGSFGILLSIRFNGRAPFSVGVMINSKVYCLSAYDRGIGTIPDRCAAGQYRSGLLCYDNCRSGFYPVGFICWQSCSGQFHDKGVFCQVDYRGVGFGKGGCCAMYPCGDWWAFGLNRWCANQYCNYQSCGSGYSPDDGCMCWANSYTKSSYAPSVSEMTCPDGMVKEAGLCYWPCDPGWKGVLNLCWKADC